MPNIYGLDRLRVGESRLIPWKRPGAGWEPGPHRAVRLAAERTGYIFRATPERYGLRVERLHGGSVDII